MEKSKRVIKSIKFKEVRRLIFDSGDKVKIEFKVKEPIEIIINRIKFVYE